LLTPGSLSQLWDVDTGECLHVFRGHIGEIYSVAFDGARVITGSLDSTVRVWDAETGCVSHCHPRLPRSLTLHTHGPCSDFLALLQGHTLLVGQMQLDPYSDLLVTAGSDGTVMVYSLATYEPLHRIKAHSQSVTSLQFDERFILSGGNDGRLKLWGASSRSSIFLSDLQGPRKRETDSRLAIQTPRRVPTFATCPTRATRSGARSSATTSSCHSAGGTTASSWMSRRSASRRPHRGHDRAVLARSWTSEVGDFLAGDAVFLRCFSGRVGVCVVSS